MKQIEKAVDYKQLDITSSAFTEGGLLPEKYTCEGENIFISNVSPVGRIYYYNGKCKS
jgi:phosphatidylethanolamine-binding protein (PEBP) family uncharacterized protein